jgi:hypothetical protein
VQLIDFMKNMALTGGFLYVSVVGAGDFRFAKRYNLKWS